MGEWKKYSICNEKVGLDQFRHSSFKKVGFKTLFDKCESFSRSPEIFLQFASLRDCIVYIMNCRRLNFSLVLQEHPVLSESNARNSED